MRGLVYAAFTGIAVWMLCLRGQIKAQEQCIACHGSEELVIKLQNGTFKSLYVDPKKLASSVHRGFKCVDCHTNMRPQITTHGSKRALTGANTAIPKGLEPFVGSASRLLQPALIACINCHKPQFKLYKESEHANSIAAGGDDAPVCTDCHGSHYILADEDEHSPTHPSNVPNLCATCHANEALMRKLQLNPHVVITYWESFHGKKLHLGSKRTATCISCHGYHAIRSPNQPESPMHISRRASACASCHKGGGEKFSLTFTHKPASPSERPLVYWFDLIFEAFVIIVLVSMFAYTLLDAIVMAVLWLTRSVRGEGEEFKGHVRRWDAHQIIQHLLFMGSVMALMLTGLPLKSSSAILSSFIMKLLGGADRVGVIHRAAGIVMLVAVVYHLLYLIAKFISGKRHTEMLPTVKDFVDFYQSLLFLLRLCREPPKMGRYNFVEKFLYWAAGWGILMMGITGLMLWKAPLIAERLSPQLVEIAQALHSHEAVLATFALLCFHLYFAHLRPDVFPMSMVWLTGKISMRELKERHELEYERLRQSGALEGDDGNG